MSYEIEIDIKRSTGVVDIFPNEAAIRRLVGAILLAQNNERAVRRGRYLTLNHRRLVNEPVIKVPAVGA